jgi:DNA-binding transcriptional LysR family regulator
VELTSEDLLLILVIAEEGSLTAAAQRLTTSQPALSRTLGNLERRAGTTLFERRARGMAPTPAGEALATQGRAVRAVTRRAQRELEAQLSAEVPEVVVGIVPQISVVPVSRAIVALGRTVRVQAGVGAPDELLPALRRGELDVFVGPLPEPDDEITVMPLFASRPVLVARSDHPAFVAGSDDDMAALAGYPWLTPPAADPAAARLRAFFQDAGLEPPAPSIVTGNVALALTIVGDSDFIALLPRDVAQIVVRTGLLRFLPIDLPGPDERIGAVERRDPARRAAVERFIEALRHEVQSSGVGPS